MPGSRERRSFPARASVGVLVLLVGILAVPGCASDTPTATEVSGTPSLLAPLDADAAAYAGSAMGGGNASVLRAATTVEELFPNREIGAIDGTYAPVTETVVLGTVTNVEPEAAYVWSTASDDDQSVDFEGPETVSFEDPRAEHRTWLVSVAIEETVSGAPPGELIDGGDTGMLLIRLNSYPQAGLFDADRFERGLESLGRSVWFLSRRPNWPDAFDVAWFGRAVGVVEADGAVVFPMATAQDVPAEVLEAGVDLEELRRIGSEPTVRISR